jgi:hypothetical protein
MIIINTVNNQKFSLNGIEYFKNFLSVVIGNKISIYNAYDKSDEKVSLTIFSDFEINGLTLPNVASLQSALLDVIYTRDSLGITGGINQSQIYNLESPSTVSVGGILKDTVLTGRTTLSLWEELLVVYLEPSFSSESPVVTGQASTVEVGTTLSGNKTFTWVTTQDVNIKPNTIAIYDISAAAYLVQSLANDGTESITINTLILNSEGSIQQWRAEGTNTNEVVFISPTRTVTARYKRYYGSTANSVTNSSSVKALPSNEFQTSNINTFILNTGNAQKKFTVALPPSRTISEVIDLDALNANITSNYILTGTINVTDAAGTNRAYNIYEMNIGEPYSASHRHQIKTA